MHLRAPSIAPSLRTRVMQRMRRAEALAAREVTAFDRSAAVIARRLAQRLELRPESARRPKKYYAARRLL